MQPMTQLETDTSPHLASAYANDRAHVFHSWSAQGALSPTVIAGAKGSRMWDDKGNTWLDFSSQLVNVNIGHQHPKLVAAIQAQAARLCTIAPFHANDMRSEAARLLAELAPGDLDMVFFTNGGTEAIENAVRLARGHTGRHKVLSAYRSYHGATGTSIMLTGDPRRWGNEPGAAGAVKFWGPYLYRSAFHATTPEEECERALEHLANVLMVEGPHTVAAIVLETVVGTNGVLVPPDGYLAGVRALCNQHGIVMVCDEVMAGFGRCGEWFAVDRWKVTPDLIAFAKGSNSGYLPIGGVLISKKIVETYRDRAYPGGLTYSGHPLACASVVASIGIFKEEKFHIRHGEYWVKKLADDLATHDEAQTTFAKWYIRTMNIFGRPGSPKNAVYRRYRLKLRDNDEVRQAFATEVTGLCEKFGLQVPAWKPVWEQLPEEAQIPG